MKLNTTKVNDMEIYQHRFFELVDEYISTLEDPELLTGQNKMCFAGLIKYINMNLFKREPLNNNNIDEFNAVWDMYTTICCKYAKNPTIIQFSLLVGVSKETFDTWRRGEVRKSSPVYADSVKKWLSECESALYDAAAEQSKIGAIFALKANYGYRETAPTPAPKPQEFQLTDNDIRNRYLIDDNSSNKDDLL